MLKLTALFLSKLVYDVTVFRITSNEELSVSPVKLLPSNG